MENLKSIDKRFGQPVHSFTTFNQSADKLYLNPKVSPVNALSSPSSYQHSTSQRDTSRLSELYNSTRNADYSDNGHHQQYHSTDGNSNCSKKEINPISKNKHIRFDNYNSNKCIQRGKQLDANRKAFIASNFNENKARATKFSIKTERKDDNPPERDSSHNYAARCELEFVEHNYNSHRPKPSAATCGNNENHKIIRQRQHQRVPIHSRNVSPAIDTKSDISKAEQISNLSKPLDTRTRVRCGNIDEISNRERTHNFNPHSKKLDSPVAQANCWTPSTHNKKNMKGASAKFHQKTSSTTNKTSMSAILKEKCELLMSKNNLLPRSNSLDGTKDPIVLVDCKKPSQSVESLHQMPRSEFSIGFRKEPSDQNSSKFSSSDSLQNSELRLCRKLNDNRASKRVVKFATDRSNTSHMPLKKSQSVDSQLDYSDSSHYCHESNRSCKDEEFLESKEPSNLKRMANNYGVKLSTLSNKTRNINEAKPTGRTGQTEDYNRMSENDVDNSSNSFVPDKLPDSEISKRFERLGFESQSTPWYQEIAELSYCLPSNKRSDTDVNDNINQNHNRKAHKKVDNSGNKLTAVAGATLNQSQNSDDYHDGSSVCTKDLGHDSGIDSSASYPQRFAAYYLNSENNTSHMRDSFREVTNKGKHGFADRDDIHHAQSITSFTLEKSRKWAGKDCAGVRDDYSRFKSSNMQFDDASSNASTVTISDKGTSHNSNQEFYPIKNREDSFDSLTRYSKASASTNGSRSSRKRISYLFGNKVEQKSTTGSNSGGSSSTEGRVIGSSIRRDRRRSSKNQLAYITVDEKSKKAANRSSVRTAVPESTINRSKRKGKGMLSNTCKVS